MKIFYCLIFYEQTYNGQLTIDVTVIAQEMGATLLAYKLTGFLLPQE